MNFRSIALVVCITTLIFHATQAQPSWLYKLPKPGNKTYLYVVEYASGRTELEARNQAIIRVFQSNIMRLGYRISSSEITEAVQKGKTFEDIAILHRIPVNKVCEYTERVAQGYQSYVLCQVAKDANIRPNWDDFTKCSRIKRQKIVSKIRETSKDECGYVVIPSMNIMVQNTDLGVATSYDMGVLMCRGSQLGGYNDWRLPTKREIMACYLNAYVIGGFSIIDTSYYLMRYDHSTRRWSSDKGYDIDIMNFKNGVILETKEKDIPRYNVRAVRTMDSWELELLQKKKAGNILELR